VIQAEVQEVDMPGVNILCVFKDAAFSENGFAALKQTTYIVTSADCAEEAERDFSKNNYQVVVIGPGLFRSAKERLAMKAWESGCAVVVVCSEKDDYKIMADEHVDVKDSGLKLVPAVLKAVTAKFYAVAV
jgi:hypothetical protein